MLYKDQKGKTTKKIKKKNFLKDKVLKEVSKKQLSQDLLGVKLILTEEEKAAIRKKVHFLVGKFVNHLMISGKKESAERIFMEALLHIHKKENLRGLYVFLQAIENTRPTVDIRSVRRGGASYQIPVPLKEKRSLFMSIKWLVEVARKKGDSLALNLCNSLVEASKNQGEAVKKREAIHLIALKNRSLTHFRWF